MPNADSITKAKERREARVAGKAAAVEKSAAELIETAKLSELQGKAKSGDKEAASTLVQRQPQRTASVAQTKKQRQEAARKEAEKQAERDVRVTSEIDESELDLATWTARGQEPPLHILNAIAQRNDQALREDARELARAVGQYAYEQAVSADTRGRHVRERRIAKALAQHQAQQAAVQQ